MPEATAHPPEPDSGAVLRRVIRNVFALGAGELASRVIGFLCTIWVARQLGIDGYGIIGFASTVVLYAAAVTDFGLEQHGPREVAEGRTPIGTLIPSVAAGRLALGLGLAGIMAIAGLLAPQPDGRVLSAYALVLLPVAVNVRWVHLGLQRPGIASAARLLAEGLRLLVLVLTVSDASHIVRVPLAQFAGDAAAAVLLLASIRRSERADARIDPRVALAVFRRASPLLAAALLAYVIYNSDVIFLRLLRPVAETGLYLAAYAPINLLGVLGIVTVVSLVPALTTEGRSGGSAQAVFADTLLRLASLAVPVAVGGFLLAGPLIELAFGPEYRPAGGVLAILIWTFPLLILRSVQQAALVAADDNADVLRTTAWAAAINVGLNFIAVPLFGMLGAATTTLIAEIARFAFAARFARRLGFRMPAPARFRSTLLASAVMAAGLLATASFSIWIRIAVGAAVVGAVLLLSMTATLTGRQPQPPAAG